MQRHRIARGIAMLCVGAALGSIPARAHEDRDATLERLDAAIAATPGDLSCGAVAPC
jgi:hypothetical protein